MSTSERESAASDSGVAAKRNRPAEARARRCACGDGTCASCRAARLLQLQPVGGLEGPLEGEAEAAGTSAAAGEPVGALSAATGAVGPPAKRPLLADDAAVVLGPGQVRQQTFLAALQRAICAAAEEDLAGTGLTTDGCPELDYWFAYYSQRSAEQVERAIRRYAPETTDATSASDLLPPLLERVRRAVRIWLATGRVSGVPEELSFVRLGEDAVPGGAADAFSVDDRLLFARDDGPSVPRSADPDSVRDELGAGRPLESGTRARMESSFARSFQDVRIHDDAATAALAGSLGARAFTVGDDIGFGAGEYRPETLLGRGLLAHELAHTIQQRGGGAPAAVHERDATQAALAAATGGTAFVGAGSGLALQRCGKTTPSDDAGVQQGGTTAKTPVSPTPQPTAPAKSPERIGVESVTSPQIAQQQRSATSKWNFLKDKKLPQRDKFFDDTFDKAKSAKTPSPDQPTLDRMKARWSGLRKAVSDAGFNPESSAAPWLATVLADAKAEASDVAALKKKNKFLEGATTEFVDAVTDFATVRGELDLEPAQFHRFDDAFLTPDVTTLLGRISPAIVSAADLKALLGKESTDFTNIKIAGIDPKKPGIHSELVNADFVGIAQIGDDGLTQALKEASKAGVTIPESPDPRTIPVLAIKLAAAFLIFVARSLDNQLPEPKPTGADLKRFMFAAYNAGPKAVAGCVKGTGGKPYSFATPAIRKCLASVTGQPLGHVEGVEERHPL